MMVLPVLTVRWEEADVRLHELWRWVVLSRYPVGSSWESRVWGAGVLIKVTFTVYVSHASKSLPLTHSARPLSSSSAQCRARHTASVDVEILASLSFLPFLSGDVSASKTFPSTFACFTFTFTALNLRDSSLGH